MKLKEWGAFTLLGMIWGSSFLWIKIAVREIGPFTLVAFRLLFGLAGLLLLMYLQKQSFPRDRRIILTFLVQSFFQTALPFVLISWGETKIDSGLASILNGTMPLFTIVIAHLWLHDEKITLARFIGLVVSFIGVVVLVSRDLSAGGCAQGSTFTGSIWGQLAVLGGAASYATGSTFSRRYLRGQSPVVQSTMVLLLSNMMLWAVTPIVERPLRIPALPITWFAVAWLGLLGSCLAYVLFFYLINTWGPTRASLVTYVLPVIGLILGIIFLKEGTDWRLVAGSLLIVAGIAAVNLKLRFRPANPVRE